MLQQVSGSLQSSHPFDRETTNLVYRRTHTKKSIKMVNNTVTPIAGPAVDSGSTRFGSTPGGAFTIGIWQRSVPGGKSAKLMFSIDYTQGNSQGYRDTRNLRDENKARGSVLENTSQKQGQLSHALTWCACLIELRESCTTSSVHGIRMKRRNIGSSKNKIAYQPPRSET